jgi:hypothetical protein
MVGEFAISEWKLSQAEGGTSWSREAVPRSTLGAEIVVDGAENSLFLKFLHISQRTWWLQPVTQNHIMFKNSHARAVLGGLGEPFGSKSNPSQIKAGCSTPGHIAQFARITRLEMWDLDMSTPVLNMKPK